MAPNRGVRELSNEHALRALLASDLPADTQANRLWFGQYAAAAVLVAHRMALFDRCHPSDFMSIAELARALGVHDESLMRLCRVLHCRELLDVDLQTRAVRLTPQSRTYWRRDSILFRGPQFEEVRPDEGEETPIRPFHQERIWKMLREGWDPARSKKGSFTEMWQKGDVDPDATLSYNEFMRTQSFCVAVCAVRTGVYSGVEHFVDLGGGSACFSVTVKAAQPETACSIFDLAAVCQAAESYLEGFPSLEVALFPSTFFGTAWPVCADCFNLCNVLHDWPPERCDEILANAHEHLAAGGRLVLSEVLLDEDMLGPEPAVVFDMLMYMNHRAQQFSFGQLARMTEKAGFVGLERIAKCGDYTILVARNG